MTRPWVSKKRYTLCSNCNRREFDDEKDICRFCRHIGYSITLWGHVQGKPLPNQPKDP